MHVKAANSKFLHVQYIVMVKIDLPVQEGVVVSAQQLSFPWAERLGSYVLETQVIGLTVQLKIHRWEFRQLLREHKSPRLTILPHFPSASMSLKVGPGKQL